jgi:hypothetical protein
MIIPEFATSKKKKKAYNRLLFLDLFGFLAKCRALLRLEKICLHYIPI